MRIADCGLKDGKPKTGDGNNSPFEGGQGDVKNADFNKKYETFNFIGCTLPNLLFGC